MESLSNYSLHAFLSALLLLEPGVPLQSPQHMLAGHMMPLQPNLRMRMALFVLFFLIKLLTSLNIKRIK